MPPSDRTSSRQTKFRPEQMKLPDQRINAAVYARVSTEEQAQHGTSLGEQTRKGRAYADAQGWEIADEYVDEGVSGAAADRPALDRLKTAVRKGDVDVVIVAKLDRLGRSMRNLAVLIGEFDDRNVRLVSVAESFDSGTPSGRLQRNILGSFAEFEREQISERSRSGQLAVATAGYWPGGLAPYGWRSIPSADNPRRTVLAVSETESAILLVAIAMLLDDGLSTWQIAQQLNALGHIPRVSDRFSPGSVRHLLANAPLDGRYTWRREIDKQGRRRRQDNTAEIEMTIPALTDEVTQERVRSALRNRTTGPRASKNNYDYLLSRRISSPHGAPMYGMPQPAGRRYVCAAFFERWSGTRCDCHRVSADDVETATWNEVVKLLSDPTRLHELAEAFARTRPAESDAESDQLLAINRRIRTLEVGLSTRLTSLIAAGVDTAAVVQASANLQRELEELRKRRTLVLSWQAANQQFSDRIDSIAQLSKRASEALASTDQSAKRQIYDLLDVKVKVLRWYHCPTCHGHGLVKSTQQERPRTADVCPTCKRSKWLPEVKVTGIVPTSAGDSVSEEPMDLPFEVVPRLVG